MYYFESTSNCYVFKVRSDYTAIKNSKFLKEKKKWRSFYHFEKHSFSTWVIEIDSCNFQKSTYMCSKFLKKHQRKLVIGWLICLKLVTTPAEAKRVPLSLKKIEVYLSKLNEFLLLCRLHFQKNINNSIFSCKKSLKLIWFFFSSIPTTIFNKNFISNCLFPFFKCVKCLISH